MRPNLGVPIAITLFLLFTLSAGVRHAEAQDSAATQSVSSANAHNEAAQMVAARAILVNAFHTRKAPSNVETFSVILVDKVRLTNGLELPLGTALEGSASIIKTDWDTTVIIRIDKADLRRGTVIPVKVTIMGIAGPSGVNVNGYDDDEMPSWDPSILSVDQMNALGSIDLHSAIANDDSGILVSPRPKDVKISAQSQFELAIAAVRPAQEQAEIPDGGAKQ